jgi:hypothetical protein
MLNVNAIGNKLKVTSLEADYVRLELTLADGTTHTIPKARAQQHDVEHVVYGVGFSEAEETAIEDLGLHRTEDQGDTSAWDDLFSSPSYKTEEGDDILISSQLGISCTLVLEMIEGVAVVTSEDIDIDLLVHLRKARQEVKYYKALLVYNMLSTTASAASRYRACDNVVVGLYPMYHLEAEKDKWLHLSWELSELAYAA